jgi:hypothetical protein
LGERVLPVASRAGGEMIANKIQLHPVEGAGPDTAGRSPQEMQIGNVPEWLLKNTGIDIVLHQAGILHQYLLHGAAVSKESQDVLYGKSCAPDDGFAYHYFGIYCDPFQQIFINHEDSVGCSFDIRYL